MNSPLALITIDPAGGYAVIDSRSGMAIAWRGDLLGANDVSCFLNSTYPDASLAPALDSLIHELVCHRIAGCPVIGLDTLAMLKRISLECPPCVPRGPGWDHLIGAA